MASSAYSSRFVVLRRKTATNLMTFALAMLLLAACGGGSDSPTALPAVTRIPERIASPLASPVAASDGSIALDRGNRARTGVYSGPAPTGQPVVKWKVDAGNEINVSLAVVNGFVYAVAGGDLVAFDQATGTRLWKSSIPAESAPAEVNGTLFIGGMGENVRPALFALDAKTGEERWQISSDCRSAGDSSSCNIGSSPLLVFDLVIVASPYDLLAVDAASAAERWRDEFDGSVRMASFADGVVVTMTSQDRVVAVDATSGQKLWESGLKDATTAAAIASGRVFIASSDKKVVALDFTTGAKIWETKLAGSPSSPAVASDLVFITTSSKDRLTALDADTGAERWHLDFDDPLYESASIAGGVVFVASGPKVFALDPATGTEHWRIEVGGRIDSGITIANGVVYVGTNDGDVYAITGS